MITGPRLILVLVVVISAVATPVSAAGGGDPEMGGVVFRDGNVDVRNSTTYLWQTGDHSISANVTNLEESNSYQMCAETTTPNGTTTELGCTPISDDGPETVAFGDWPTSTGRQDVTLTVRRTLGDGSDVANRTVEVYVMSRTGDEDGDSLTNRREAKLGTDFLSVDTDTDGIEDGAEVDTYMTDPLDEDTDGDGLIDGTEVNGKTNVTDPDTDGDGLLDGTEVNEYGTNPVKEDTDGDGLSDGAEVHVYGTDPLEVDTDGDGLTDSEEVNKYGTNPVKVHSDSDGLSDGTEVMLGTWPNSAMDVVAIGLAGGIVLSFGAWTAFKRLVPLLNEARSDTDTRDESASVEDARDDTATAADPRDESPEVQTPNPAEETSAQAPAAQVSRIESDEERILTFLREAGGSMQQKEIVESTEWSSSKVSRLLSKMDDAGLVTKVTIGRENIIQLETDESEGPSDG